MNPIENPFNPGAGIPPPELEGREALLEQAGIILARVLLGRGEKNLILTGLRGVGKTVLLNKIRVMAEGEGYKTIFIEASEEKPLAPQLATGLGSLVYELSYMAAAGKAAKRAMRLLSGFIKSLKVAYQDFSISLDMGPDAGTAGTGDIEIDLPDLFQAVGNAAREQNTGVALFIDEIQYLESNELGALIMAIHRIQQHQLPVVLFAAGLPTLPGLAGDAKSYAERLFDFPIIGPLTEEESAKALNEPARAANAHFEDDAIEEIFHKTKGYPYFLQEWGYQSWNESPTPTITLKVVKTATEKVVKRLDNNFFRFGLIG